MPASRKSAQFHSVLTIAEITSILKSEDDGGETAHRLRTCAQRCDPNVVWPLTIPPIVPGERDLREMLFHPGFSTAHSKTELAGRGVGLDVVRANLNALNGEVEIQSTPGLPGTKFLLSRFLSDADHFARAIRPLRRDQLRVAPRGRVEEIRRIRADEIEDVGGKLLEFATLSPKLCGSIRTWSLPPLQMINGSCFPHGRRQRTGNRRVGLRRRKVPGEDEIVIKSLGEYLRRVKLFPGTTIAPDGSLILLIDLNRMVAADPNERRTLQASAGAARIFAPGSEAVARGNHPHRRHRPRRARTRHRRRRRFNFRP